MRNAMRVSLGLGILVGLGSAIASIVGVSALGVPAAGAAQGQEKLAWVGERRDYVEVPLATLKGSVFGGDPTQLPVMALTTTPGVPLNLQPRVVVERPQPNQAIAWVTYIGLEDDSVRGIRYRVDMESTGAQCACQGWRVVWVGQQYQCQAGRGTQDWSTRLCS